MTDVLNLIVDIYRKETESSGTIIRKLTHNFSLKQGDEIRFSIMNVEENQSFDKTASENNA